MDAPLDPIVRAALAVAGPEAVAAVLAAAATIPPTPARAVRRGRAAA